MNALTYSTAIATGRVQLAGVRLTALFTARLRVVWLACGFCLLASIALVRVAFLGLGEAAPANTTMADALLPARGEIVDRHGEPLARAFPAYALWYNPGAMADGGPPLVRGAADVARALHAIFPDIDTAEMTRRLASGKSGYLRRRVLPEDANRIQAIGELALEVPEENDRHYPQGSLAAHVLGYIGPDGRGTVGMEQVLEKQLLDPAQRGRPVALSIDARVQGALEDELRSGMMAVNAKGAAGIILDVDTGEVMALASLPDFNPNAVDPRGDPNVFNRATNSVFELGSIFKPLTVAAAIDAGVVRDLSKRWEAGSSMKVAGRTIHDSHNLGATLNVPQALIHSSNIVTARVADAVGTTRIKATFKDLGFAERPFIELPARGMPIWQKSEWSRIKTLTVSYGHGIAVTPMHLAGAYAAMVNGGIWRPATLHKLRPGQAPRGRRVFSESTSARMRQLLRMIVVYGTGRSADATGFRVGGKTGSAEKATGHGYARNKLVSSFAAAFPMDDPRYVIVVTLDEPEGTQASSFQRTAAWNAAPIVGRVVPRVGPMLGVIPDDHRDIDLSDLAPLVGGGH